MSNLTIEKIRVEKIRDFYIINRTGQMIFHHAYIKSKMDDSLLSGFLTAIFAISEELSMDNIQVMDMEDVKFIYENYLQYIFALNVNKDVSLKLGKSILSQAMRAFENVYEKFEDENDLTEKLLSINFGSQVDEFANNAILEEYFDTPLKIVEKIESFLVSLFGSMGTEIIDSSIKRICKLRSSFKSENLEELLSLVEDFLKKKVNPDQAGQIMAEVRDTFLTQLDLLK
ncbi:MAG: hypothetical protein KAX18_04480 [Candidatus Lokiarchaeota archaeon]|nr:hypothetical protein [Candidatus Lokiarchaeota archaeon]